MEKSKIVEALKDETAEFFINDNERVSLCELLVFVAEVLDSGKLWINSRKSTANRDYANLCRVIAKRFANMPVHREN